jgi:tripartite-type tricarboxylate transporter receptor subunit TctC
MDSRKSRTRAVGLEIVALGAALACGMGTASAQAWPSRPVTMVVPFTAGTTSDVVGRSVAEHLGAAIGQTVVIENRGGAGGNIGAGLVAKAAPDGYTILLATTGPAATNKLMYANLPFDSQRDLTPVVLLGKSPVIIVARPDAPVKSIKDLVEYGKANPGKLTAGYPGNGTLGHITGELLQVRSGIKIAGAQYRGSAPIMTDLLGGHIDLGMDSMAAYVPNVKEGRLRALAIAGGKRWSVLPDVPTVAEAGIPGFEASVWYALLVPAGTPDSVWYALLVPAGTPDNVVRKLNEAANAWLKADATVKMFESLGVEASGGTPEVLRAFIAAEIDKWAPVVQAAGIKF